MRSARDDGVARAHERFSRRMRPSTKRKRKVVSPDPIAASVIATSGANKQQEQDRGEQADEPGGEHRRHPLRREQRHRRHADHRGGQKQAHRQNKRAHARSSPSSASLSACATGAIPARCVARARNWLDRGLVNITNRTISSSLIDQPGTSSAAPSKRQQRAERGRLGAGLDAGIGVGHAEEAEAAEQQEQRSDEQRQGAQDGEKAAHCSPPSR